MMNKKLIVLLVAISTISALSADCYIDNDGYKRCYVGRAINPEDLPRVGKETKNLSDNDRRNMEQRNQQETNWRERMGRGTYRVPPNNPYDGSFYSDPTYSIGNGTNRNMGNR